MLSTPVKKIVILISTALCLCALSLRAAEQFVDLTVEVQGNDWDYWFFSDQIRRYPGEGGHPRSIFTGSDIRHLIIGTNLWMIEGSYPQQKTTWWFTGSNMVHQIVVTGQTPEADIKRMSQKFGMAVTSPKVGSQSVWSYPSTNGNPGRPVRVADIMSFDMAANYCWLAFCSGQCLKQKDHKIYPPSSDWKESRLVRTGWTDETELFKDDLSLAERLNLVTTNDQSIFKYQVRRSTNFMGWNIPLEFYGVQYLPSGSNAWKLHMTLKGRVTAIRAGTKPRVPNEVLTAAEHAESP